MSPSGTEHLHTGLDALQALLPGDDHASSEQRLAEHLQAVAELATAVQRPSDEALRDLLAHQQRVLGSMMQLRDQAADQLNQGKRSLRAAQAYLRAESLA